MIDEKLAVLEKRYRELTGILADPAVLSDQERFRKSAQEMSELEPIMKLWRRSREVERMLGESRDLLGREKDEDFLGLVKDEIARLTQEHGEVREELTRLLTPKDPFDEKSVVLEIRAGTGGEEAALFAAELLRMYTLYADAHRWRVEPIESHSSPLGGFKEVIVSIEGKGVYSRLKYEAGVHRVQRIPVTESGGRIHTSTVTVAVLAEAEDVEVSINPDELRIDVFRSSGPGGQHVNKTESAVRITHLPTGMVVTCQDEKSQHKNRAKAMVVLRARLLALAESKRNEEISESRRRMVGTGDRSERIRTYNFPQSRVTDHRIGLTSHRLQEILRGDIDEFVDRLAADDQARALKQL